MREKSLTFLCIERNVKTVPVLKNYRYEKFVQCLITGMSQRKAYREAYPASKRWKDTTVDSKASTLNKNGKVAERYNELLEEAQDAAILTRKERMVTLSNIARDADKEADSIKAIDVLNKMDNLYVTKTEMSGSVEVTNPYADLTTEELRKLAADHE